MLSAAGHFRFRATLAGVCFLVLTWVSTLTAEQRGFQAGAKSIDITPKTGVLLDGTISKNGPVLGIHDRLFSRALVLTDGRTTIAIVVNDACLVDRTIYDAAKKLAARETGIPTECMLMCATHSHAAVRAIHIGKGPRDDEYHEFLSQQMAAAVIQAHQNLAPAKVGFGSLDKPTLFSCRRFLCKPDSVSLNPFGEAGERVKSVAGTSTAVLHPAGTIDPQLSIVSVLHDDGSPLAVLANYSAHYCGGYRRGWVSADYFGAFARQLEMQMVADARHPAAVAMLSNGTSGDAGAITLPGKFGPFEKLERAGQQMADDTLRLLQKIDHSVPHSLAMRQSEIELNVRRPNHDRITWAQSVLSDESPQHPHRWTPIYAREAIELSEYPAKYKLLLQSVQIGDIGIAAIPCEVFGETGLAIKQQSRLPHTFTMELANGYGGYLPPPTQHRLGGYETWPARSSHLEVDAEPKIREEVLRLLDAVAKTR